MLLDHDRGHVLADTADGTLTVREDEVGLRAESVVTDPAVIEGAVIQYEECGGFY